MTFDYAFDVNRIRTTLLLVCLTACGCAERNSVREDIGGGMLLSSLSPDSGRPEHIPADGPSLRGLYRGGWDALVIGVPSYGITVHPTYATQWRQTDATHRQRNEYPNASSALEEFGDQTYEQQLEAWAAPFLYFGDFLMIAPRMVMQNPARPVTNDNERYARSPMGVAREAKSKTVRTESVQKDK